MWLRMTHSCYVQWDGEDDEEREAPRDQNRQGDERVLTRDVAVAVEESSADYERRANGEHQQIHFSTLHTFFFFFRFLRVRHKEIALSIFTSPSSRLSWLSTPSEPPIAFSRASQA